MCHLWRKKTDLKIIGDVEGDTTYLNEKSYQSIEGCVETIMFGIDRLMKNSKQTMEFLLIRPPGHHSNMIQCSGFCVINNIWYGANYLQSKYQIKKIAIVDYDVHHGNGTHELFYNSKILFIDIHRYDGIFYPKTGNTNEIGTGEGINYTVNIPMEKRINRRAIFKRI